MIFSNLHVELKTSTVLDLFLYLLAKQNTGVFFENEEEIDNSILTEISSFIPKNNLEVAEENLIEVIKGEFINDDNSKSKHKLLTLLHNMVNKNYLALTKNKHFYIKWWQETCINSIAEVPSFIENETGQKVSKQHYDLILESKKVFIIPSLYIYPQIGFNFINNNAYILLGLAKQKSVNTPTNIIAQGFSALGEIKRLAIIELICQHPKIQSKEIAERVSLKPATVSHHLNTLVQAGIISRYRNGRQVTFSLEKSRMNLLVNYLKLIRQVK
ncbi:winged helix-turn-helix transcriptional regulator [Clostridium sp. 'deep sea']|uniref:ArsR/SmtB family transcription factor n=1 Tax=Clostridium sp. 'deep sea' TaxID=2779445 RepID=UPI0018965ED8|nr:metalloregulator ArsR/SmtB family transcription factor [Clostridium sp. 'deep sea']QOR35399.1 winged helix-turn-helix transcriptional regulator [Clostridium sp. 'deep sea']